MKPESEHARLRALLADWSMALHRGRVGAEAEELDYARWERTKMPEAEEHEYKARLGEVPDDTRDLTARICGDPLPGRSALARRHGRQRCSAEKYRGAEDI